MSDLLGYLVGAAVLVVGLGVSIGLHELGHLLPAKLFGVRAPEWMIGFGPTLWSRRRGGTEYGIKAIPLGGYTRMIGMYPPPRTAEQKAADPRRRTWWRGLSDEAKEADAESVGPGDESRTFIALPVPKRLAVMAGGITANLLLAVLCLVLLVSVIGIPTLTTRVSAVSECVLPVQAPADATCGAGDPPAPAAAAGIEPGDRIVAVAGERTGTWPELSAAIRDSGGETIEIVVERDGSEQVLTATPVLDQRWARADDGTYVQDPDGSFATEQVGFLGVSPTQESVPQPLTEVPQYVALQFEATARALAGLPASLGNIVGSIVGTAERDPEGPVGVVGVTRMAGEIAAADDLGLDLRQRAGLIVSLLAALNASLAAFNLIPLLPMDGGHIAGALGEWVRRGAARLRRRPDPGPLDMTVLLPLTYVVGAAVLGLGAVLIVADLVSPVRLFG